ncbi:MAG: serine hydrolase domain-containing protein [Prolixibacteraceae bacterium]
MIPPYYELEIQGLNSRLTNEVSDIPDSSLIEKQVVRFMNQWDLKGVSIAVVKDERLVYAQGFGIADDSLSRVNPGSLFRLASVSKLITAVAVMKLAEEKKLSLNDPVFGPRGIIKNPVLNKVADKRIYDITVRHLLAHAGGWTQRAGDPAFNPLVIADRVGDLPPANLDTYYKFIAKTRLSFTPGSRAYYSNMGYMFLADVIGATAGEPYETYIRKHILIPAGIIDMHIGNSYRKNRFPNEVRYYEPAGSVTIPECNGSGFLVEKSNGGNSIKLLGAAGGWISSAVELARFITYIDGERKVRDILSRHSIQEMTDNTYAKGPLGWRSVSDAGNWYRTGSMAGTSAMIKRQADGISWVFISNSSCWKGSGLSGDIERLMNKILAGAKEWPERDLFQYYPIQSLKLAKNTDSIPY